MKRKILTVLTAVILLLAVPVTLICFGFCLPAQYSKTYYAELPKMLKKLKETDGKRLVFVGNSALAFGLAPDILESEIDGYSVCPFGLYGAIGTKTMMDLSEPYIREGDIVVLAPEPIAQSMSLYFNSEYVWNAADGDFGLLSHIRNKSEMTGGFLGYTGRKFNYYSSGSAPDPQDVYAAASFDENCKMIYDRPYNRMPLGYDANAKISFDSEYLTPEFADYVNGYNKSVARKGATLLYGFAPVNASGLAAGSEKDIEDFYDALDRSLDCRILGNPYDYIFEKEWFYDANVHMNSYGAVVYTERLVRDLKAHLGDSSPVEITLPDKPEIPKEDVAGDDGKDAGLFVYAENGAGWSITGMTDEGKGRESVEIPDFYKGKRVLSFSADTFAGNGTVKEIKMGANVYGIADGSFAGCAALERIVMPQSSAPSDCNVYSALLDGAPDCRIYVPREKLNDYRNDYFWSRYGAYLSGY